MARGTKIAVVRIRRNDDPAMGAGRVVSSRMAMVKSDFESSVRIVGLQ